MKYNGTIYRPPVEANTKVITQCCHQSLDLQEKRSLYRSVFDVLNDKFSSKSTFSKGSDGGFMAKLNRLR